MWRGRRPLCSSQSLALDSTPYPHSRHSPLLFHSELQFTFQTQISLHCFPSNLVAFYFHAYQRVVTLMYLEHSQPHMQPPGHLRPQQNRTASRDTTPPNAYIIKGPQDQEPRITDKAKAGAAPPFLLDITFCISSQHPQYQAGIRPIKSSLQIDSMYRTFGRSLHEKARACASARLGRAVGHVESDNSAAMATLDAVSNDVVDRP